MVDMLTEGKDFISAIKDARIKHGLTIRQVESLTGVPYRSLQNWEAGVRKCPDYVTNMIVTMINQKFGTPDHQMFLEELLEMFKSDSKHAKCEETKEYIENLIMDVSEHLNK
jgi:transcriptional regulator with XRE-family HTH domain